MNVRRIFTSAKDGYKYFKIYLRITLETGIIWGRLDTPEQNNARLRNLRPKEMAELDAIRAKYEEKVI